MKRPELQLEPAERLKLPEQPQPELLKPPELPEPQDWPPVLPGTLRLLELPSGPLGLPVLSESPELPQPSAEPGLPAGPGAPA